MPVLPPDSSPIDALPRPLAVAAHDAGAANMIASWCASASSPPDYVCVEGPATSIFAQCVSEDARVTVEEAVTKCATVLTGTGWASDLEHRGRMLAAAHKKQSVAVIDHWVNYETRFHHNGEVALPDKIVVGDPLAGILAREAFPRTTVEEWPNTYLAAQVAECGPQPDNGDTLFVAEPARSDWGRADQGEFQTLDWFVQNAGDSAKVVRLRPHPSDPAGKYDAWLACHTGWSLDNSASLAASIHFARRVAGLNSMAMVVALEAGRDVICAIPPWGPDCALPHSGIVRLG